MFVLFTTENVGLYYEICKLSSFIINNLLDQQSPTGGPRENPVVREKILGVHKYIKLYSV